MQITLLAVLDFVVTERPVLGPNALKYNVIVGENVSVFDAALQYSLFFCPRRLLDRDTFRQIARLVDVGPFEDGDVVGKQLDRDRVEQRGHERVAARHRDA